MTSKAPAALTMVTSKVPVKPKVPSSTPGAASTTSSKTSLTKAPREKRSSSVSTSKERPKEEWQRNFDAKQKEAQEKLRKAAELNRKREEEKLRAEEDARQDRERKAQIRADRSESRRRKKEAEDHSRSKALKNFSKRREQEDAENALRLKERETALEKKKLDKAKAEKAKRDEERRIADEMAEAAKAILEEKGYSVALINPRWIKPLDTACLVIFVVELGLKMIAQGRRFWLQGWNLFDTAIVGVSRDSVRTHENFCTKQSFPFDLISDADEELCSQFDVIKEKKLFCTII